MLNFKLMSAWQNWAIVFLMISIGLVGLHIFIDALDRN